MKAIAIKVAISVRGRTGEEEEEEGGYNSPWSRPVPRSASSSSLRRAGLACFLRDILPEWRFINKVTGESLVSWLWSLPPLLHLRPVTVYCGSVRSFIYSIFWWYYMNINQALVMQQAGVPPSALCSWWELLHLTEAGLVPGPGPAIWRVVAGGPALQPSTAATRRIWRLPASPRPQLRGTDSCSHCSSLHTARSGQQECN